MCKLLVLAVLLWGWLWLVSAPTRAIDGTWIGCNPTQIQKATCQVYSCDFRECCQPGYPSPCDYTQHDSCEVWRNACTLNPVYENCYPDPACGYTAPSSTPVPTSTPAPSPTPYLNSETSSTSTIHATSTPAPTYSQTSSEPTPTSAPKTAGQMQTTTITPTISIANATSPLAEIQQVVIQAAPSSSIDIQLQSVGTNVGTILLGRVSTGGTSQQVIYSWNTLNTPNGSYKIFGTVYWGNNPALIAGPLNVTVYNPPAAGSTTAATSSSSLSLTTAAPETIADITFPAQFDPKVIPEDQVTKVEKIVNTKTGSNTTGLMFSGKSVPNTIITVLVYSNPIVVTVKTDKNGMWSYTLEKPLESGNHVVYVVVPNANGEKTRSPVASFTIAPAYAASTNGESLLLASANADAPLIKFALATMLVIAAGLAALLVIYHFKRQSQTSVTLPNEQAA